MTLIRRRPVRLTVAVAILGVLASACGGGDDDDPGGAGSGPDLQGQALEVAAVWTGAEQANFRKVLDEFSKRTGATVTLTPTGDNISTYLGTKIQGGQPPDVAMLPQQGVLVQFVNQGALKPVSDQVEQAVDENFAPVWKDLATVDGTLYGVYFKASNKSTVWYRVDAFENAGVEPPATWDELVERAQTISYSGVPPVSIGAADGWVLTDWFENVYLSQAGPGLYDKLADHEIPWTHPSVVTALRTLAQLWGRPNLIAGGTRGALNTSFPASVTQTFTARPEAAMVYEGDFVRGVITSSTDAEVGEEAKFFPFPAVGDGKHPVVGGGDVAVALTDSAGAEALLEFLASADAARIWAEAGGFTSPNTKLDLSAYPDEISRQIAKAIIDAGDDFRFDLSDLAPAAFGGTKGVGMWRDLQEFFANPSAVQRAAQRLEADAAQAYPKD